MAIQNQTKKKNKTHKSFNGKLNVEGKARSCIYIFLFIYIYIYELDVDP